MRNHGLAGLVVFVGACGGDVVEAATLDSSTGTSSMEPTSSPTAPPTDSSGAVEGSSGGATTAVESSESETSSSGGSDPQSSSEDSTGGSSTGGESTGVSTTEVGTSSSETSSSETSSSETSSSETWATTSTTDTTSSDASTSGESTGTDTSTTDGTSSSDGVGTTTTGDDDPCDALPPGPFVPVSFGATPFSQSEDLAFDGHGELVALASVDVDGVDAAGSPTTLAMAVPQVFGLRYRDDGSLVGADFFGGALVTISPAGVLDPAWVPGLTGPNGVFPDALGNVWVTEWSGDRVLRIDDGGGVHEVVTGAAANTANGVWFDESRSVLFFDDWQDGVVRAVRIDPAFEPTGPVVDLVVGLGNPDGMTMDECGNLYMVDNGTSELVRIELADDGMSAVDHGVVASFGTTVSNALFGVGAGFDEHSVYVIGNPGVVWVVAVGIGGAATVLPP